MTSLPTEFSDHGPVLQRAWEWWLVAFLAAAAAALGAYGLWLYDVASGERADIWSIGYHTLQLFVLHSPHLEHRVPWQLNLGRWLSAVVVLGTVARGLAAIFRSECRLFWAQLRHGHVVICGLGRLGTQLAREFRRDGWRVVAIEASGSAGQIATAHDAGVAVITGDACSPSTLTRAAVGRASKIIAVCDDEQKNVAIAARVGELLASQSRPLGLECWMFITDPRLRETFQQDRLFPHTGEHYRVNVRGLDIFELTARQILRKAPLDYERIKPADPTVVHLVIVGFGTMGRHLALQAARIGHFANFQKLRVTVVEQQGSTRVDKFLDRHPEVREVCDFRFKLVDMLEGQLDTDAAARTLPLLCRAEELVTVAVCWDSPRNREGTDFFQRLERDDAANLSLALKLARNPASGPQIFIFQTRKAGFAALFPIDGRGQAIGPRLHAFGMLEDSLSLEALLHEREDAIAKALHKDYYEKQLKLGRKHGERPALFHWEHLPEHFRDSNRRAADHLRVKMRAIGYRVDETRRDQSPVNEFDRDQIELLARMEHESWSAEWLLQNYSYGPGERNDVAKTQPYLVSWDKLADGVQECDRSQVRAIPEALRQAGYGIYPQVQ